VEGLFICKSDINKMYPMVAVAPSFHEERSFLGWNKHGLYIFASSVWMKL